MHAAEADAFGDEGTEGLKVVGLDGGVAFAAIGIDDDGVGIGKGGFVFDPAHVMAVDDEVGDAREALFQEDGAGAEFMHAGRVRGFAGDEDELVFAVRGEGMGECGETDECEGGKKEDAHGGRMKEEGVGWQGILAEGAGSGNTEH
jgi:hypothetical protein